MDKNCCYSSEPVREKTNNLGSDQARHKPGCTVTKDGYRLGVLDLESTIRVAKISALVSFTIKYCEADLRLCFCLCRLCVFPCGGSNVGSEHIFHND